MPKGSPNEAIGNKEWDLQLLQQQMFIEVTSLHLLLDHLSQQKSSVQGCPFGADSKGWGGWIAFGKA